MANIDPADIAVAWDLPAEQAQAYLRRKGYQITWNWQEMTAEAHQRAFTVAKAMNLDVLTDIRRGLEQAQERGTPFDEFRRQLEPMLRARGWWGKQSVTDPSGTTTVAQLGSPWRLQTIYRTNLQSAYMAGRLQQQEATAQQRPFGQMIVVRDSRSSKICPPLDGLVFRLDELKAKGLYPPLHFNCRTRVRTLSERQLAREGLSVTPIAQAPSAPAQGFDSAPTQAFTPDLSQYPKDLARQYRAAQEQRTNQLERQDAPLSEPDPLEILPNHQRDEIARQWFTQENVTIKRIGAAEQNERAIFGRQLPTKDMAKLVGAMNGSDIEISDDFDAIFVTITHPLLLDQSIRTIYRTDAGTLEIHNDLLVVTDEARQKYPGIGTRIFATEVAQAKRLGVRKILTYAAGDVNSKFFNGYYTWPRLGYDAELSSEWLHKLPPELKGATRLRHLFATIAGQKWWKENGGSIELEFDLTEGNYSLDVLRVYLNDRGIKL